MNIDDQVKNCIKHIEENYPNIAVLSMQDIIKIALKFGEKDAQKHAVEYYKRQLEEEQKQKELEASREDYTEDLDEEGRTWYHEVHSFHQRDDSRKLKPGDIIQYEAFMGGYEGETHGMMLVNSFDFKSDFACRSYFNFYIDEKYKKADKWEDRRKEKESPSELQWSADSCPGIYAFSFATEQEIENFFKTIKEEWPEQYEFYFSGNYKFIPEYIKERYSKYIN